MNATTESGPGERAERRLLRWATALTLLPLPLWFIANVAFTPAPVWRAEYRANPDFSGAGAIGTERELQRYWDRQDQYVPGDLDVHQFAARWDTCLRLDAARDIPFMLVSDGGATFSIDGSERLSTTSGRGRSTRGDVLRLEAGSHFLRVVFQARGWPSIALLASFDGGVPAPVGSGKLAPGVRTSPPGASPPGTSPPGTSPPGTSPPGAEAAGAACP